MNEHEETKFDQLLYEAGLTASGCWEWLDDYAKDAIQRFFELTVRDCSQFTDPVTRELMLKHFGIVK